MDSDQDWQYSRNDRGWTLAEAGAGALRVALLFGSGAVAIALLIAPIMDGAAARYAANRPDVDSMSTASVSPGSPTRYTIRRSVLQPSRDSECIIRPNGDRSGEC